jgi:hypothetical protein
VRDIGHHPNKNGHRMFQVEGKPRPMLVIQEVPARNGKRRYQVLPITSKKREDQKHLIPIGNIIDPDTASFIDKEIQVLPENMISREAGKNPIIRSCDKGDFLNIMRIVQNAALRA